MIQEKIKILSEYLSKQKNVTWKESKAFNELIDHCNLLDNNYKEKTVYLERLASHYIDHIFELNQDHINEVTYEFITLILLRKLKLALEIPSKYNYRSIENNILGLDILNNNKIRDYGSVSVAMKLFVRDTIVHNTRDKYEST
tara:strand:- start:148 stop:576 length:429 start_codon:yes stop_codon:yes gene_type:complete